MPNASHPFRSVNIAMIAPTTVSSPAPMNQPIIAFGEYEPLHSSLSSGGVPDDARFPLNGPPDDGAACATAAAPADCAPHWGQNAEPSGRSPPHLLHFIEISFLQFALRVPST